MAIAKHIRNNGNCPECCCPSYLHADCGGIWHLRLIDDDPDHGYIHYYKCDKCGLEDKPFGYAEEDIPKIEFKE